MKKTEVYFINQWQIQYYEYNTTEESHEFPFQNLLSVFP